MQAHMDINKVKALMVPYIIHSVVGTVLLKGICSGLAINCIALAGSYLSVAGTAFLVSSVTFVIFIIGATVAKAFGAKDSMVPGFMAAGISYATLANKFGDIVFISTAACVAISDLRASFS